MYNEYMKKIIIVLIFIGLGLYFFGGNANQESSLDAQDAQDPEVMIEQEVETFEVSSAELDEEIDELETLDFE